jgi:prefoldin alpha subunit
MPPKQNNQQMQLQHLSMEQLKQLKDQLDGDIQSLSRGWESLRGGKGRYNDSKQYLDMYKTYEDGQEVFVPLSSSLYVGGSLTGKKEVLVDVGTGYFIEQSVERAQSFFTKRSVHLTEAMDNISEALTAKKKQQNQVMEIMQAKQQAMSAAQQSGAQNM